MSYTDNSSAVPRPASRRTVTEEDVHTPQKAGASYGDRDEGRPSLDGLAGESDSDKEDVQRAARRIKRANTLSKDFTEEEGQAVVKKLDRRLVLFLAFLYLLSFLDRSSTCWSIFDLDSTDLQRYW